MKKALLLPLAALLFGTASAQVHCYTDEVHNEIVRQHPEIATTTQEMLRQIERNMKNMDLSQFAKTTASDTDNEVTYHVPIVFHVIHNYNTVLDFASDAAIMKCVTDINNMYNRRNADTSEVIDTYKGLIKGTDDKYIGKANITFHLATIDPEGNPSRGITRKHTYLSDDAGNYSKFDLWPPQRYMNVWIINFFGEQNAEAAAFAFKPDVANYLSYYDGVITLASYLNRDNTISHELGHTLSLDHPWGGTNQPDVACGDDGVDDTPPTRGHNPPNGNFPDGCQNLAAIYDTKCIIESQTAGKGTLNALKDKVVKDTSAAFISFKAYNRLYIDSVKFYPTVAGANYEIALKKNGDVIDTYNGTTVLNPGIYTNGLIGKTALNTKIIADNVNGRGVSFRVYDSVRINAFTFNRADTVNIQPYTIVLEKNGVQINSVSGVTDTNVLKTNVAVNWMLGIDSVNDYTISFSQNPFAFRDTFETGYPLTLGHDLVITDDTTNGYMNYFYGFTVRYGGNHLQTAPVAFVTQRLDTNDVYAIQFTVNPGIKVDTAAAGYTSSAQDVFKFVNDVTNGYYGGFYNWGMRYGNYYKIYDSATAYAYFGDSSSVYVDYPDTTNAQNVMDYTYCSKMFTHLQTIRMRAALESPIANRSNLISESNLALTLGYDPVTGTFPPMPNLPPTPDFSIVSDKVFTCADAAVGNTITFTNQSWNATVTSVNWDFSNNATNATSTSTTTVNNRFATEGWATVALTATSSGGSATLTRDSAIYVAPAQPMNALGYVEEFEPGSAVINQYPMFNFYGNDHKWELVDNAGTYDRYSMRYKNKDNRSGLQLAIDHPGGDMDDFYTPGFTMNQFSGPAYLTFQSAGAFTTNNIAQITDVLEIDYTTNCGQVWSPVTRLKNNDLGNNGTRLDDFTPIWSEWKAQSFALPNNAKTAGKVYFRFRFKPGAAIQNDGTIKGTGNNFYIDRISISEFPLAVNEVALNEKGIVLAPNPTNSGTSVVIKNNGAKTAQVRVTDVTGKLIYSTEANLTGSMSMVEIPASAVQVKGIYMVQVIAGNSKFSEKLVVY